MLLKSVVQALPTYCMGVFQLPILLGKYVNNLMQSFWWQHMNKNFKIHLMSREKMGRSKSVGGMGFRDLVQQGYVGKARVEVSPKPNFSYCTNF
jgi:hypothetical protein